MLYSLFILILNNGNSIMVPWYPPAGLYGGGWFDLKKKKKKNKNRKRKVF